MRHSYAYFLVSLVVAGTLVAASGCKREARSFEPIAPNADTVRWTRQSDLQPGGIDTNVPAGSIIKMSGSVKNDYEENAQALSEGKRLYSAYNCVGCHAHGGGAIGPALMDEKWIYGSEPQQVFSTIVEGRPNGMPSFGARLPAYQIWQLAAYVRSMSGLVDKQAAPGRDDAMKLGKPENSRSTEKPVDSNPSKSEERPK
ncbi:MAG: c-type cytochrome [Gemmataceae bacterium]